MFTKYIMITIDTSKLDKTVASWYATAKENDKLAALNIGFSIICSDTYNKNSNIRTEKLQQIIDTLRQKLELITHERDEARNSNAKESLNEIMTQPIIQSKEQQIKSKQQQINSMNESHKQLVSIIESEKRKMQMIKNF